MPPLTDEDALAIVTGALAEISSGGNSQEQNLSIALWIFRHLRSALREFMVRRPSLHRAAYQKLLQLHRQGWDEFAELINGFPVPPATTSF